MPVVCPACTVPNHAEANFCAACGHPLPSAVDERRRVTLLFADIKGSTEIVQEHAQDPEHVKKMLAPLIAIMRAAAERYGGQVDRIPLGDAILAVFGAPQALEDHAVRACFAALSLQAGIAQWNRAQQMESRAIECQVRIGLNSGEIVTSARQVDGHFGEATILASRLQGLAAPGQVLLSRSTWQLARGFIRGQSLGHHAVKGKRDPLEVFELVSMDARTRFHARQNQGLTPFVGRDHELAILERAYAAAATGRGQVVTVTGSPGMGKSRLLHHFVHVGIHDTTTVMEAAAEPYDREALYVPIANLVRSRLSIAPRDDADTIRARLESQLPSPPDVLAAAVLLDVAGPHELRAWGELDRVQKRRRIGDALRALVFDQSSHGISVLLIEDLQWLDDDTLRLIDELTEDVKDRRVLVLLSTREPVTESGEHRHVVRVDALDAQGASDLLSALVGDAEAAEKTRRWVLERADGEPTPLFIEETVSALVERGALSGRPGAYRLSGELDVLAGEIPESIETVLGARIDRLPRAHKDVLEAAAVIGMESPVELLGMVSRTPMERLLPLVRDLEVADLMYESLTYGQSEFRFKHTITREVTATRIPSPRKQLLHARTVSGIEKVYAHRRLEWIDRLADHASRAGLPGEALRYYVEACKRALERSASRQAVTCAEKGLELLKSMPEPDTALAELDLQLLALNGLLPLGEMGRIATVLTWARDLAHAANDPRRLAKVEVQFALYFWEAGRHDEALKSATTAFELATAHHLPHVGLAARLQIGIAHHALGEFTCSLAYHRAVLDELSGAAEPLRWAADPAVVARAFSADSSLSLGDFAGAAEMIRQGDLRATALKDPYARSLIDAVTGRYYLMRNEPEAAVQILERGEANCIEHEVHTMLPAMVSALGTAYVRSGRLDRGVQCLQDSLDRHTYRKAGNYTFYYLLMAMAEAEAAVGRLEVAAAHAAQAEQLVRQSGERAHLAQALRLRATILADQAADVSEALFTEALAGAERCAMRPLMAECHHGLACLLQPTQAARAAWHADEAHRLFDQLGLSVHTSGRPH